MAISGLGKEQNTLVRRPGSTPLVQSQEESAQATILLDWYFGASSTTTPKTLPATSPGVAGLSRVATHYGTKPVVASCIAGLTRVCTRYRTKAIVSTCIVGGSASDGHVRIHKVPVGADAQTWVRYFISAENIRSAVIFPSRTHTNALTPVGASPNWRCVDEAVHDGDTTHVGHSVPTDSLSSLRDRYQYSSALSGRNEAIYSVRVHVVGKAHTFAQVSNNHAFGLRFGSTDYDGATEDLTGAFVDRFASWATHPVTAAVWKWVDLNAAISTLRSNIDNTLGPGTAENRFTQTFIEVLYGYGKTLPVVAIAIPGLSRIVTPSGGLGLPPKLSARLALRQSGSVASGLGTYATFALKLIRVDTVEGDF